MPNIQRSLNLELSAVGLTATENEIKNIILRRDQAWEAYKNARTQQKKFEDAVNFVDRYYDIIREHKEAEDIWEDYFVAISLEYGWM